ncbi:MAG TPA: ABC transporter permease [Armatimonadota bacterium]|nr:ABC transporter permease [Armatimonadota bacterium]
MSSYLNYAVRRLALTIPILWGVFTVTFVLFFVVPGDPARLIMGQHRDAAMEEAMRKQWGLDKPKHEQYWNFLKRVAVLDFGQSFTTKRPVTDSILERLPATAILGLTSLTLGTFLGVAAGLWSAMRANKMVDNTIRFLTFSVVSIPFFLLAIFLQWIFGQEWRVLPVAGYINGPWGWWHFVLPVFVMTLGSFAGFTRLTRTSILEVLTEDYSRTAKAKGLPEVVVIVRHALRNAMIPLVTSLSVSVAGALTGAFFVEAVFAWPGVGLLAVDAINNRDFPVIMGTVMFGALLFVLADIVGDLLTAYMDPRITLK